MKNALKDCYQNAGDGNGSWKVPEIKKYCFDKNQGMNIHTSHPKFE